MSARFAARVPRLASVGGLPPPKVCQYLLRIRLGPFWGQPGHPAWSDSTLVPYCTPSGAYLRLRCVVTGLVSLGLGLADHDVGAREYVIRVRPSHQTQ